MLEPTAGALFLPDLLSCTEGCSSRVKWDSSGPGGCLVLGDGAVGNLTLDEGWALGALLSLPFRLVPEGGDLSMEECAEVWECIECSDTCEDAGEGERSPVTAPPAVGAAVVAVVVAAMLAFGGDTLALLSDEFSMSTSVSYLSSL
jgi:hypothetical protein